MKRLASGAIFVTIALLAGCKSAPEQSQAGFLGDYSQLKPAPDREGVMLYVDQGFDFRPYNKLMFDPVQVLVTPTPDQPPVPPEVVQRIGLQFQQSLAQNLAPAYQIVDQPGPDVLRVRAAITGLESAKPPPGAVDFLPVKALFNVSREATVGGPRVAEMKAELEVLAPGNKRVAAATVSRRGDETLPQGGEITWDSLTPITDYWARNFRSRLDQLRGVGQPPVATAEPNR
jgi:hypothetical protein